MGRLRIGERVKTAVLDATLPQTIVRLLSGVSFGSNSVRNVGEYVRLTHSEAARMVSKGTAVYPHPEELSWATYVMDNHGGVTPS